MSELPVIEISIRDIPHVVVGIPDWLSAKIYKRWGVSKHTVYVIMRPETLSKVEELGFKCEISITNDVHCEDVTVEHDGLREEIWLKDMLVRVIDRNIDNMKFTRLNDAVLEPSVDDIVRAFSEVKEQVEKELEEKLEERRMEEERRKIEERLKEYVKKFEDRLEEFGVYYSIYGAGSELEVCEDIVNSLLNKMAEMKGEIHRLKRRVDELEEEVKRIEDFKEFLDENGMTEEFIDWVVSKREDDIREEIREEYFDE